jgi:hypothetical protein
MGKQSFKPKTVEQLLKEENFKKEIEVKKNSVIKLASECLADPKFMKYQDEFKGLRKHVFELLRQPIDPDPIRDAHYLRGCVNTIIVLDMLIDSVEKDSKA